MTIATNIYVDYWEEMIESLEKVYFSDVTCTLHIFTDQIEKAKTVGNRVKKISVEVHEIPAYGWPDATLRRYEIFHKHKEKLNQDVLMHLDADMLFLDNVVDEIFSSVSLEDIALVAHPGFWNIKDSWKTKIKNLVKNEIGAKGSWEDRAKSSAYVPRELRKRYVCGGVWIGKRDSLLNLIERLAINVELDRDKGIEAVWHDESHLNAWAARNAYGLLSPRYCYVNEYDQLADLKPGILAVTKTKRTRT
jgi:hypothetical protein